MHVPVAVLDNFFENPDAVRSFGLAQEYRPAQDGRWPGVRTQSLNDIDPKFFHSFCRRVLNLFYADSDPSYFTSLLFQKVPSGSGKGWVHVDSDVLTAIVYLNPKADLRSGTSIYRLKEDVLVTDRTYNKVKTDHYLGRCSSEQAEGARNLNNDQFEETIKISNVYNRLIVFDSSMWHAAQDFDTDGEDRLTLIGFFRNIDPIGPVRRSLASR